MKIVNLDGYAITLDDLNWDVLAAMGEYEFFERTAPEDILPRIDGAEAIFTSKCRITEDIMKKSPALKFIGCLATGYDNIDIAAAKALGIAVCNTPAYSTMAVAQHVFAMILEITNGVGLHNASVQAGKWQASPNFCFVEQPLIQLSDKSLGIIGYGNIGKQVAEIGKAFGMEVNIYSRDPEAAIKSDILSLHCPATPDNAGFINREFISRMKDGAILINTARGSLINEADLAEALKSGKLSAAACDVLSAEPPKDGNPLIGVPNLILTPHIAWATRTARETVTQIAAENLKSFLAGGSLNRIV